VPTKKQRRRRAKDRRHEYEYVYVDDEGREVEVADEPEAGASAPVRKDRAKARARSSGRVIQPPSWRRVGKRGLIFAPLMFVTVMLLAPDDASFATNLFQTLFLLLVFLPFSYVMDSVTYRLWRRRTDAPSSNGASPRR
jgi:hypothetical protein